MGKYTAKNKKFTIFSLKSIEKNVEIYYNIDRNKTGGGGMDFKAEQDRLDKIKWAERTIFALAVKKRLNIPVPARLIAIVTATSALRFCAPVNKFFTAQTGRKSDKQRLFSS